MLTVPSEGGYYSTSNDLIKFGKGILRHQLLSGAATRAWLKPRSPVSYGYFGLVPLANRPRQQSDRSGRIIDIYTKTGSMGDSNSLFVLIPDYGLVMTVPVGW